MWEVRHWNWGMPCFKWDGGTQVTAKDIEDQSKGGDYPMFKLWFWGTGGLGTPVFDFPWSLMKPKDQRLHGILNTLPINFIFLNLVQNNFSYFQPKWSWKIYCSLMVCKMIMDFCIFCHEWPKKNHLLF